MSTGQTRPRGRRWRSTSRSSRTRPTRSTRSSSHSSRSRYWDSLKLPNQSWYFSMCDSGRRCWLFGGLMENDHFRNWRRNRVLEKWLISPQDIYPPPLFELFHKCRLRLINTLFIFQVIIMFGKRGYLWKRFQREVKYILFGYVLSTTCSSSPTNPTFSQ